MITFETLQSWLNAPSETEHLEFKEAKTQFDTNKLFKYCAALANEGGGYLVLGVTDNPPRKIIGTTAFSTRNDINDIKHRIVEKLHIRIDITELPTLEGRVLAFEVPTRCNGQPVGVDGAYWMRSGQSLVPMTQDMLKRIFAEGQPDWLSQPAKENATPDEVIALLDTQKYFDLLKAPYPTNRDAVLAKLESDELIIRTPQGWTILNLSALLLAKKLDSFSFILARKAPRVIIYEGSNKLKTKTDITGNSGYAIGFEGLLEFVYSSAPQNHIVEQTIREETKMFPKQALRELIANAMVHQDFTDSGASVIIEMYEDRIEISNLGLPLTKIERFIDGYKSRNERLADIMRRLGICEEKGSGVDKVIANIEEYQLPAPDFRVSDIRTIVVMFSHKDFSDMSKRDRIRACYQHCCLLYVSNKKMTNQTLRERFGLPESASATISVLISTTKTDGLIKQDDSETNSTRYANYLPSWA
ncbi:MAG: ATP-binding protein [Rickettsiales bacterium]